MNCFSQGIGELAPEKPSMVFPPDAYGADLMFSEGGFGLGGFSKHQISLDLSYFVDISFSEAKDQNEFEYVDYFGQSYTPGKKNRVFLVPVFAGINYRLFASDIGDNLRPYVCAAVGPTMVATTPSDPEFFSSFKKAQAKYTPGGYIGVGAYFGSNPKNLFGISVKYYIVHFFNDGVESLEGRFQKNLGGIYISLTIGSMY